MAARKEALMNTVRQEVALANAQELMNVKFCVRLQQVKFSQCLVSLES